MAIVNPRQLRDDFAKATGKLTKTDPIEAAVLAHFAEAVRPEPRPLAAAVASGLLEAAERARRSLQKEQKSWQNRSIALDIEDSCYSAECVEG